MMWANRRIHNYESWAASQMKIFLSYLTQFARTDAQIADSNPKIPTMALKDPIKMGLQSPTSTALIGVSDAMPWSKSSQIFNVHTLPSKC